MADLLEGYQQTKGAIPTADQFKVIKNSVNAQNIDQQVNEAKKLFQYIEKSGDSPKACELSDTQLNGLTTRNVFKEVTGETNKNSWRKIMVAFIKGKMKNTSESEDTPKYQTTFLFEGEVSVLGSPLFRINRNTEVPHRLEMEKDIKLKIKKDELQSQFGLSGAMADALPLNTELTDFMLDIKTKEFTIGVHVDKPTNFLKAANLGFVDKLLHIESLDAFFSRKIVEPKKTEDGADTVNPAEPA